MPTLLVATVAGTTSNSYVTIEEAEAYFALRLQIAAWTAATTTDKEKALIGACRAIESLRLAVNRRPYGYPSEPADSLVYDSLSPSDPAQVLSFPRKKDRNSSGAYAIPERVKKAQYEEALALLSFGAEQSRRAALQAAGVSSFSVDGLSESYREGAGVGSNSLASTDARKLIAPYLRMGGVIANSDLPDGEFTPGSV